MRPRGRRRRRVIGDFSGRGIEPTNEAVVLIRVPDDSIAPYRRIVRERPLTRYLVLDDGERRSDGCNKAERGKQRSQCARVSGKHSRLRQFVPNLCTYAAQTASTITAFAVPCNLAPTVLKRGARSLIAS